MANGATRNWQRVMNAVKGFRAKFGAWPTRIRLGQGYIDEFRTYFFSRASWAKVEEKLRFVADEDAKIVAEDEQGRWFSYGDSKDWPEGWVEVGAEEWLAVPMDGPGERW